MKIINFEIGIASFVRKLRCRIKIGIRRPPPPIPPALDKDEPIRIKKQPKSSALVGG